jgi:cytochrome c oxidase subunit IV
MSEHVLPFRTYVIVWIALMLLMALTVFLSTVPMGHAANTIVALIIAAIKAALVLMFFMHLKYESYTLSAVVFGAGLFWLLILFGLSLVDYLTRGAFGVAGH